MLETVLLAVLAIGVLFFSVVLHEIGHGLAAYALGDDTAKRLGRLSLNPLRHVDPVGSVFLPLLLYFTQAPFLFGWAKPVPVALHKLTSPDYLVF